VDADPTWSFDRYQAYEDVRFRQSLAEQEQALSGGLVADPKSQPHGGYRIACVWPEEVTARACALSARLAELLPHSSVGNIAAPGARLVDPDRIPEDRKLLDCLQTRLLRRWSVLRTAGRGGWPSTRCYWLPRWPSYSGGRREATRRCTPLSIVPARFGRSSWCRAGGLT
jgi:hypothetical protein